MPDLADDGAGGCAAPGGPLRGVPGAATGDLAVGRAPVLVDVVVLAGGTGARLDGASKPEIVARGARLLDHLLGGLESLRAPRALGAGSELGRVCVVAPESVALPQGVLRALEDPPLGGPVAGVAAGLLALRSQPSGSAPLTALLTCDAPGAWQVLPALLAALNGQEAPYNEEAPAKPEAKGAAPTDPSPGTPSRPDQTHPRAEHADGACPPAEELPHYLLGVYRTASLLNTVAPNGAPLRDVSVKRTFARLRMRTVNFDEALSAAATDLDTWAEVQAWDHHP